jgi:peroxiredoxin
MKIFKKLLSLLLALAMVLSLAAMITGCKKGNGTDDPAGQTTGPVENGAKGTYHVSVKTNGGMPLKGIAVYIYGDAEKTDLKEFGETDEEGKVSFDLPKTEYFIDLEGVAKGYDVKDSYSFSGNAAEIVLTSSLVTGESLSGASLGLGDVMYDFSVATPEGETVTLSEVLAENKMVLLNFFFTTCSPCITEFPYMQEAYDMYKDAGAAVIAIDPMPSDNNNSVGAFKSSMGLTFPMAACEPTWSNAFSITGYPTSVVIDREGRICLIHPGAITDARVFDKLFETFTAENYTPRVYHSINDLL